MIPSPKSAIPAEKIVAIRNKSTISYPGNIRHYVHLVNGVVVNAFDSGTSRDWIAGYAAGRGATIEEEEVSS